MFIANGPAPNKAESNVADNASKFCRFDGSYPAIARSKACPIRFKPPANAPLPPAIAVCVIRPIPATGAAKTATAGRKYSRLVTSSKAVPRNLLEISSNLARAFGSTSFLAQSLAIPRIPVKDPYGSKRRSLSVGVLE